MTTRSDNTQVLATLRQEVEASQAVHAELDDSHARSARLEEQLIELVNAFSPRGRRLRGARRGRGLQPRPASRRDQQMQETQ